MIKAIFEVTGLAFWLFVAICILWVLTLFVRELLKQFLRMRRLKKTAKKLKLQKENEKPLLLYSTRKQVADEYEKWLLGNNAQDTGVNFVSYLAIQGWLDNAKIKKDLGGNKL